MSENVGGVNVFSSGGHRWLWGDRRTGEKVLGTIGVAGVARLQTHLGERTGTVAGLLKASAGSVAAANAALTALERAIESLADSGASYSWEDDVGHSGSRLVVGAYRRRGPRIYGGAAGTVRVWQEYQCPVSELDGAGAV